ncbi:putative Late nodulin [Medicago truncatula]|uniref:Nodule Cysteine-Rich (NCR) secreted peptide n=1 Tax=Medicago truncatula TaxID=3880 RepID=A0A072TD23_MEDTR|nr:Nodule Cysteine-Rich (NCR) secreted peptide [Medicago truncatula]RHN44942.1 putative Late nodulin [Medicago truncatula]
MADIIKFIYVIIIVLFVFFSGKNTDAKNICIDDVHCQKYKCSPGLYPTCINGWCECK